MWKNKLFSVITPVVTLLFYLIKNTLSIVLLALKFRKHIFPTLTGIVTIHDQKPFSVSAALKMKIVRMVKMAVKNTVPIHHTILFIRGSFSKIEKYLK